MKNENFKKVTFFNYLKFKIKWIFRVIKFPSPLGVIFSLILWSKNTLFVIVYKAIIV